MVRNRCLTEALEHCDSGEMELKVINVLFDSTSCCDRDSVARQLPAAFRWLFWLCVKSEVALPSLVLHVPAQMGFLVQIDVLITAKKKNEKRAPGKSVFLHELTDC